MSMVTAETLGRRTTAGGKAAAARAPGGLAVVPDQPSGLGFFPAVPGEPGLARPLPATPGRPEGRQASPHRSRQAAGRPGQESGSPVPPWEEERLWPAPEAGSPVPPPRPREAERLWPAREQPRRHRPGAAAMDYRARPRVPRAQHRHARLTRRGRAVLTVIAGLGVLIVATLAWLAGASQAQATGNSAARGTASGAVYRHLTAVVVRPGQSLWSIAQRAEPAADPRAVVQEIIDLNALGGPGIWPGERLWVPKG